jgi:hypothetical protein
VVDAISLAHVVHYKARFVAKLLQPSGHKHLLPLGATDERWPGIFRQQIVTF